MSTDPISRIAYHECGHAIAAVLLGGEVDHLTIEPDADEDFPDRSGEVTVTWPEESSDREVAILEIKVSLSGPIVEMIYDENQVEPEYLEEWKHDWELAVDRARKHLPRNKPVAEHLAHFVHELMTFFERDDAWAAVSALADELEAYGSLEGERIEEILEAWPIYL